MVLSGAVNKALAAGLTAAGLPAVGLSGRDAGLIRARLEPGLGRVGTPERWTPRCSARCGRPASCPWSRPSPAGPPGESVNVNADEAALALARALRRASLVYLSDVDGVRVDERAPRTS